MLHLEKARVSYPSFHLDVSLMLPGNRIAAIVGPNGSGKTTLIKAILQENNPEVLQGTLFDQEIDQLSPQTKQRIGVVYAESGFSQILTLKAIQRILKAVYPSFDAAYFKELIRKFSLNESQALKSMSSGQKNLVKLVAALSHKADLLILDEPTNGLDVEVRARIQALLAEYVERYNASILITSHISADLESFADEIHLLKEGKFILDEPMDVLHENYALLVSDRLPDLCDLEYILTLRKNDGEYEMITNEKQFFEENYPEMSIEPINLDLLQLMYFDKNTKAGPVLKKAMEKGEV